MRGNGEVFLCLYLAGKEVSKMLVESEKDRWKGLKRLEMRERSH